MNEKKRIFDLIFFNENYDILSFRINFLKNNVHSFLILCSDENIDRVSQICEQASINYVIYQKKEFKESVLLDYLKLNYSSFKDLILFSEEYEIPNLNELLKQIDNESVLPLHQKVYQYNSNFYRKYLEIGTVVFEFSYIVVNEKFLKIYETKFEKFVGLNFQLKNGFKFIDFQKKIEENHKTYFCPFSKMETKLISEPQSELFFSNSEEYKKIEKIAFVLNEKLDFEIDDYDLIFMVSKCDGFQEKLSLDEHTKINYVELFVPNYKLYETKMDFEFEFLKNEIFRVLHSFWINDEDEIEIHYPNRKIEKLNFSEIKNPS